VRVAAIGTLGFAAAVLAGMVAAGVAAGARSVTPTPLDAVSPCLSNAGAHMLYATGTFPSGDQITFEFTYTKANAANELTKGPPTGSGAAPGLPGPRYTLLDGPWTVDVWWTLPAGSGGPSAAEKSAVATCIVPNATATTGTTTTLPATGVAQGGGGSSAAGLPASWRWDTIERVTYTATGGTAVQATLATEPLVDHPDSMRNPTTETRLRLRVTGPPASIGKVIRISALQSCENDWGTASSDHSYSYTVKPGQYLLLPAAALKPPTSKVVATDVDCAWAITVTWPVHGNGLHHATVELSASSPSTVVSVPGGIYDTEQCTVTILQSGDRKTCTSLKPS
jgi:hypothetical protein